MIDTRSIMAANGWFASVRFWRWSFITLTVFCFLLGSAYYNINNAYIVHIDINGKVEKSDLVNEMGRQSNEPVKPISHHIPGQTSPGKDNSYTPVDNPLSSNVSEYMKAIQEAKKKLAEKFKNYKLETFAKVDADPNSNIASRTTKLLPKVKDTEGQESLASKNDVESETSGEYVEIVLSYGDEKSDELKHLSGTKSEDMPTHFLSTIATRNGKMPSKPLISKSDVKELIWPKSSAQYKQINGKPKPLSIRNHMRSKYKRRMKFDLPIGPDSTYAVQDLESMRIDETESTTFVLLVTYARSGSSWLGAITNQADETFYVFEPLQRLIIQGYYKEDLVCFNNNTCRKPRNFIETHNFAISTFHRLFTCQLTKLHPKAVQVFLKNVKDDDLKNCLRVSTSVKKCLQLMEKVCLASTHRALKTIRVSMDLVNIMMDLWPNLKVIHLVRDPRGITNSRIKRKTFAMVKKISPHSRDMCDRMYEDTGLSEKNKDRTKLVFYEALAERPLEGVQFIYNFLGLEVTPEVTVWVYNSTHAQKMSGYYGTMRADATESAYHWLTELPVYKIKIIDSICSELYKLFGFLPIKNTPGLNNSSLSLRRPVKNPDWFS